MSVRPVVLAAFALALAAPPASAQQLAFDDPCGDAGAFAEAGATRASIASPGAGGLDLRRTAFASEAGVTEVRLDLCAPPGAASPQGAFRFGYATLGARCILGVGVLDDATGRSGRFTKTCIRNGHADVRFDLRVPATIVGGAVTVRLDRATFTGEAARALAAGTTWGDLRSATSDGGGLTSSGASTSAPSYALSTAPGDDAGGGGSLVLG